MSTRLIALLSALAVGLFATIALAQLAPQKPSPFGVPQAAGQTATPAPGIADRGLLAGAWDWILTQQQRLTRDLAGAVRALKTGDFWTSTAILAFLSFSYGVLHAVGPGHGKAVISSYVLANERTMRRGILLSFMAAAIQAFSAITIVALLTILLKATSVQMRSAEAWIETISWALVAAIGGWLLYRQAAPLLAARAPAPSTHPAHHHASHTHGHGDPHSHVHRHAAQGEAHRHDHDHHHTHSHDHSACCGHEHMPAAQALEGPWSWREAIAMALAVGIRPCTGAILVLIFALSQGLLWAGVFATFAMALGTAITVSALAVLAVGSREFATRVAGRDSRWASRISATAGVAGALLLIGLGTTFFLASLQGPGPL